MQHSHFDTLGVGVVRWAMFALAAGCTLAQPQQNQIVRPNAPTPPSLSRFLQQIVHDRDARYVAVLRDLNGDGIPEAIVYILSNASCGSGGCNALVLRIDHDSWKITTKITVCQLPIRVLKKKSSGWSSLAVWVQGGGIQPGYEAELDFNGRSYPGNPTVPPAMRLDGPTAGETVIGSVRDAIPLYGDGKETTSREQSVGMAASPQPSFDCAKASTPAEKLICGDSDLASLDRAMAAAYQEALQRLTPVERSELRGKQYAWLALYSRTCNSAPETERKKCVTTFLKERAANLQSNGK